AKEDNVDFIVMTKSTKKGLTRMIGSVTASVVKQAKCIVMIVPE
ncbi:universal stress protein, partial [Clostridioides difficile]